jgi:hypothetical protein
MPSFRKPGHALAMASECFCVRLDSMEDKENPVIVEGLAVIAQTIFEMGGGPVQARETLVQTWTRLGSASGVFLAAANAMKDLPQPLEESAERTDRAQPVRTMLGVTSASESLTASLQAREVLEQLARELG